MDDGEGFVETGASVVDTVGDQLLAGAVSPSISTLESALPFLSIKRLSSAIFLLSPMSSP